VKVFAERLKAAIQLFVPAECTLSGRVQPTGARRTGLLSGGKHSARKVKRAAILSAADGGTSDEAMATGISVGGSRVYRIKRRFVPGNLEAALSEEPRPGAERSGNAASARLKWMATTEKAGSNCVPTGSSMAFPTHR